MQISRLTGEQVGRCAPTWHLGWMAPMASLVQYSRSRSSLGGSLERIRICLQREYFFQTVDMPGCTYLEMVTTWPPSEENSHEEIDLFEGKKTVMTKCSV